ncbi:hypothetical protein [Clostridium sp.]|uniref:hypothetical protein n=1 Tax=Clostridium sp. TaxID=1506 RepID=UPI0025C23181|nr:hypothetical protein [Clostridium sp.]
MDSLLKNISIYTDEEIKGELVRLIVSINDSHTSVGLVNNTIYPLKFFEFEEGIYLIDGSLEYKDYWGNKLIAINGHEVEEAKEMLKPYIAKDNNAIFKDEFSAALSNFNLLTFSGLADSDEITYTFTNGDVVIKAISNEELKDILLISDYNGTDTLPLSKQNKSDMYWFKYIEDKNIVYVKYNLCMNIDGYSFKDFTKEVFEGVDKNNPEKLIIDLRDNSGYWFLCFHFF